MLPRLCTSHSTRCCQHESNRPRSRQASKVLICQANGPNVVNVRAKIKRPSAIGSQIVTSTSPPLSAERERVGGRDRLQLRLIAVFALVDWDITQAEDYRRISWPFTMPANLITTLECSIPQCLLRSLFLYPLRSLSLSILFVWGCFLCAAAPPGPRRAIKVSKVTLCYAGRHQHWEEPANPSTIAHNKTRDSKRNRDLTHWGAAIARVPAGLGKSNHKTGNQLSQSSVSISVSISDKGLRINK